MAVRYDAITTVWMLIVYLLLRHDLWYCLNRVALLPSVHCVDASPVSTNTSVNASASTSTSTSKSTNHYQQMTKPVINIAAMLDCDMSCQERFRNIIATPRAAATAAAAVTTNDTVAAVTQAKFDYNVILVAGEQNASEKLINACEAISERNITLFVAVASQDVINLRSIITRSSATPLIAYVTDNEKHSFKVYTIVHSVEPIIRCQLGIHFSVVIILQNEALGFLYVSGDK